MSKLDEILREHIYDDHENCDDSCGKRADYTELIQEIAKLIDEVIETYDKETEGFWGNGKQELRQRFKEIII